MIGLLALGLSACTAENDSTKPITEETAAASAMPPIYIDSHIRFVPGGTNRIRTGYERALAVCHQAGLPVEALGADDVAKLGTGRLQRWIDDDRFAYRFEEWRFSSYGEGLEDRCKLRLTTRGSHHYYDRTSHTSIDLSTGASHSHDSPPADFFQRPALGKNETFDADVVAEMRSRRGPVEPLEVAGHSCDKWTTDQVEVCNWNGGRKWGFTTMPPGPLLPDNVGHLKSVVILDQQPLRGNDMEVTTTTFEVGTRLDELKMRPSLERAGT